MAPRPLPRAINRLHGSRERQALTELPEASADLVELADKTDQQTLRLAQKLLRQAMADVDANGLFITGPRGARQRNPAVVLVGQQQRIISTITRQMRVARPQAGDGGAVASSGKLINGVPIESRLGRYLLAKPDRIEDHH